jgi:hypothetical protein
MDRAVQDVLPPEWKDKLQARFRELERDGDRLTDRVRAAGEQMAAPGEGILDEALKSLPAVGPEAATGVSDGGQGSPSPSGDGEPGGGPSSEEDPPAVGLHAGRSPDGGVPEGEEEEEKEYLPPVDTDPAGDDQCWGRW